MQTPEEVEGMLRDTGGVEVISGEQVTWGHEGAADQELLERLDVIGEERVLTVATGRLPRAALAPRAELAVGGETYAVHKALRRRTDPSLTDVLLLDVEA